jgi:uncharacterized membrane protein YfcA
VTDLVVAVVVIALCAAVQGALGFGLNLLAVPVLLVLDPTFVPGPPLVAGLVLSLLVAGREWGEVDRRLAWALVGVLPGTALGLAVLVVVPEDDLGILLGLLVLVAVGLSVLRWEPTTTRPALLVAGTASGFLATSASIGGPPMALLYSRSAGPKLRSTLSAFFIAVASISIVALLAAGRFDAHQLRVSAAFLPGVVVGFLLSGPLRPLVDRGHARPAILVLSAAAAVFAIVQGLLG